MIYAPQHAVPGSVQGGGGGGQAGVWDYSDPSRSECRRSSVPHVRAGAEVAESETGLGRAASHPRLNFILWINTLR